MNVFIAGDAGYLGSQFTEKYRNSFSISGYDIVRGQDILDSEKLAASMKGADVVVHLAGIPKPIESASFANYFETNCRGTLSVITAAIQNNVRRIIYASSTTVYGIERGIPFTTPITESQALLSTYVSPDDLSCRLCDLSYHSSKVIAEQILAQYGLSKQIEAVSLRFGPIGKVFLNTSVSDETAVQAIEKSILHPGILWYEPFTIVDNLTHISNEKAKRILGLSPIEYTYPHEKIH